MRCIPSSVYALRNCIIASDALHKSLHCWDMINAENFNSGTVLKQNKSSLVCLFVCCLLLTKYECSTPSPFPILQISKYRAWVKSSHAEMLWLVSFESGKIVHHMSEGSFGLWLIPHVENNLSRNCLRGDESFGNKMRQLARDEYCKHPVCWIDTWWENWAEYVWKNYYSANETLSDYCFPVWNLIMYLGNMKNTCEC